MWRKWDLWRSCTGHDLTSYQQEQLFVVLLLVSCYFHLTWPRATHARFYRVDEWRSDTSGCQTSHASSVMANYNWQLMLESRQAQTKASWKNNPDHQLNLNITLQSANTLRSGPATHAIPPRISLGLTLLLPLSTRFTVAGRTWYLNVALFKTTLSRSTGPLGSSQSAGSDMGSLLYWVVTHGSLSVLLVAACRL